MAMAQIGEIAPDFSLRDQQGSIVSRDDLAGSPALVVFMPLAFTRVCGAEMCEIRDNLASLASAEAAVAVITCDNVPSNRAWAERERFTFPILSDFWPHGAVTQAYGCFNEMLGVAHRSTFVLDAGSVVRDLIRSDSLGEARPFGAYVDALARLAG